MSDDRGGRGRGESAPNLDDNELIRLRREKLDSLRSRGIDPFGGRYPVTQWARDLAERLGSATDEELKGFGPVSLAGRIVTIRHHGKTCFAHLMDQTGRIQLCARRRPRRRVRAVRRARHGRLRRRDRRDVPHADG
jgi:lysyl-tRNA synthetase class II